MKEKIFSKKGFTLIELLVVVLIIGILAAIAVPQYQKAVLKANLQKGIPLVTSLYHSQHAYNLANGNFATDIDMLDLSIPKDASCMKEQTSSYSRYNCDFGTIGLTDSKKNVQYKDPNNIIAYTYVLKEHTTANILFKEGTRWCYAYGPSKKAQDICENLGGVRQGDFRPKNWNYYKLP